MKHLHTTCIILVISLAAHVPAAASDEFKDNLTGTATGSLGQTSQVVGRGALPSLNFSAPQSSSDPIVGRWRWKGNKITVLSADGKAFMYSPGWAGMHGTWKLEDPRGLERKYVITWEGGLHIDSMRLTADHERLHGQDKGHHLLKAERLAKKE